MKRFQKTWSILLVLALTVTALTAFSALFAVPVSADAENDGFTRHVALSVADGPIKIYPDRYVQNDVVHEGFPCETTLYTITGVVLGAETTFDRMRMMGKYMCLTGKLYTYEKLAKRMEKTTLEEVNALCREIFDYEKQAVCYVGKKIGTDLSAVLKKGG